MLFATTEALAQVHFTTVNNLRIFTVGLLFVAILEMTMLLSHYYWRIAPLRKEIGEGVVAPPIGWTFAYHGVVTAMLVNDAIGKTQAVYLNAPGTISTWGSPVVLLSLTVVANRFVSHYSRTLGRAALARQRERNNICSEPPSDDDL